jgi:hypothetical protein
MRRFDWYDRIHRLDPEADCVRITQILAAHEFPWDVSKALGMALYRTYAVPSIGDLLFRTGEFTERTQKRYDDTALILNAVLRGGFAADESRHALRRMNAMHRAHGIGHDDLRYVLSTFVVVPVRWFNRDRFGWRRLTGHEAAAFTHYYRRLGRHMGIPDLPDDYAGFARLLDDYERAHFAPSPGGRAVSDATLDLMATFLAPRALSGAARTFALAILDDPLLRALGYTPPPRPVRAAARASLRARSRVVRFLPPRTEPFWAEDSPDVRGYPGGYDVRDLGTFPGPGAPQAGPAPHAEPHG